MNNKPVAWMYLKKGGLVNFDAVWASKVKSKDPIPLFTHPVKELTDGQIMQVWWDANDITDDDTVIEFARAILRKAQEK